MANDLNEVKAKIDNASSILVTFPDNPRQDAVAAALALYLSLKAYNKEVAVVASAPPVVRDSRLVGLDKVSQDIGGKNLILTFKVPEDSVDKVTSNTEGGHLNLIITPKSGGVPITEKDVTFGYTGAAADLIVTVGAGSLADLGALAEKEYELFASVPVVNIGNKPGNFGAVNLTDPDSSNSELVTAMLQELKLPLDVDIANNLLRGIEDATNGLSSPDMTADTFEAMAVLYRTGARRSTPAPATTAKVVNDVPLVEVESKEGHTPEIKSPKSDWSGPKIMQTAVSTK